MGQTGLGKVFSKIASKLGADDASSAGAPSAPLAAGTCLADSLFDYPDSSSGGWKYMTLDKSNAFGKFKEREESAGSATPLAYMVGDDAYCQLGRDMVHPGYEQRPTMQWNPPHGGKYLLELEVSPIFSIAAGDFHVGVYVDDVRLVATSINYPERLSISLPMTIRDRGFVRIVFTCLKHIDVNYSLYFARISTLPDNATIATTENQPEYVKTDIDPSWKTLHNAIKESAPGPIPDDELETIARNLYGDAIVQGATMRELSATTRNRLFGKFAQNLRKPGFFSIKGPK